MDNIKVSKELDIEADVIMNLGDTNEFINIIPDKFFKLIVSSPPYNLGKEYEDTEKFEDYMEKQKEIISELVRVLADDGNLCWQVGNFVKNGEVFPLDIFYYPIFQELGLKLRNRIIWHFGHGLHASKRFSGRYETILWFTKTDDYIFNLDDVRVKAKYPGKKHSKGPNKGKPSGNPLGKNPSDFWDILFKEWENGVIEIPNVKANHIEKTIHPCQFPIELIERLVLALSNENDWVFDPYVGVGTTIIASVKNGRKVVGSEKEKKYFDIALERINLFQEGKLKIRPLGKKIYQPLDTEKVAQVPVEWKDIDTIYK